MQVVVEKAYRKGEVQQIMKKKTKEIKFYSFALSTPNIVLKQLTHPQGSISFLWAEKL